MSARNVKVLVVDDSALARSILSRGLAEDPNIEVVGTARDPYEARDMLVRLSPDVITLDVEMPRMDGVTFLKKMMAVLPTPTIIISSLTQKGSKLAIEAMEAGAIEVIAKPSSQFGGGLEPMVESLRRTVKAAAFRPVERKVAAVTDSGPSALADTTDSVIGLGASTGGVAALGRILPAFPAWTPGIVIVQHMPAGFTRDFADRLNGLCSMRVAEATNGDRVIRGHILVAPGGEKHCEVHRVGGEYRIRLTSKPAVSGHCPSVDVLFESLAQHAAGNAAACLLTGMGADGARGLLAMRQAGSFALAQDRETSAVWGMPAAAHELGAAERHVALHLIPQTLTSWAKARAK